MTRFHAPRSPSRMVCAKDTHLYRKQGLNSSRAPMAERELALETRTKAKRDTPSSKELPKPSPSSRQTQDQGIKANDTQYLRYQKWLSFMKPRLVLGFDKIPRPNLPTMSSKYRGLALCFEKLQGWTIPVHLLQDLDLRDYEIILQFSLSLFHLKSKTFFGSTWMGSSIPLSDPNGKTVLPDVIDISYPEIIYLITRLTDPSCVAVVEIVVSKIDKSKKILMNQFG